MHDFEVESCVKEEDCPNELRVRIHTAQGLTSAGCSISPIRACAAEFDGTEDLALCNILRYAY